MATVQDKLGGKSDIGYIKLRQVTKKDGTSIPSFILYYGKILLSTEKRRSDNGTELRIFRNDKVSLQHLSDILKDVIRLRNNGQISRKHDIALIVVLGRKDGKSTHRLEDHIYDTKRSVYADAVKSLFIRLVNEAELGIAVDDVVLNSITPPVKTAAAFNEVASAMNQKAALKNQAEEYSMTVLNEAAKARSAIIADAEAYRISVVSNIKSESIYFESIAKEYLASPRTVLMTLYNNTLSEVLSAQDGKYIIGTAAKSKEVRLKLNPEAPKRKKPAAEGK